MSMTDSKGGTDMPPVATMDLQKVDYLKKQEEYLRNLKKKPKAERERLAKENLMEAGIIDKNNHSERQRRTQAASWPPADREPARYGYS